MRGRIPDSWIPSTGAALNRRTFTATALVGAFAPLMCRCAAPKPESALDSLGAELVNALGGEITRRLRDSDGSTTLAHAMLGGNQTTSERCASLLAERIMRAGSDWTYRDSDQLDDAIEAHPGEIAAYIGLRNRRTQFEGRVNWTEYLPRLFGMAERSHREIGHVCLAIRTIVPECRWAGSDGETRDLDGHIAHSAKLQVERSVCWGFHYCHSIMLSPAWTSTPSTVGGEHLALRSAADVGAILSDVRSAIQTSPPSIFPVGFMGARDSRGAGYLGHVLEILALCRSSERLGILESDVSDCVLTALRQLDPISSIHMGPLCHLRRGLQYWLLLDPTRVR